MGGWRALVITIIVAGSVGTASAQVRPSDYRWHDRFFFGGSAGQSSEGDLVIAPEISFWGSDYVGVSVSTVFAAEFADWGYTAVGALPLRYVQPYAGGFLGFRNVAMDTGMHVHTVAGINGFVSRNLRVFVQWDDPPIEFLRIGESHFERVTAGVRWSPDAFHSARMTYKIDAVWVPMLLTLATWGIACANR